MKTAIAFYSKHHGNTRKLLEAIACRYDVTLIDIQTNPEADLSGYDLVGLASGIYFWSFHSSLISFARQHLSAGQRVFLMYTCGGQTFSRRFCKGILEAIFQCHAVILGRYGCPGFCSAGFFKLFGGLARKHPDEEDIAGAIDFFSTLLDHVSIVLRSEQKNTLVPSACTP